jgi:hypothetical protein
MPRSADKDRIAAIIPMIVELEKYQNDEPDHAMQENYRAAIGRLESLAYQLTESETAGGNWFIAGARAGCAYAPSGDRAREPPEAPLNLPSLRGF